MSIVKSARLNTIIGRTDGKSLTFLNLIVEVSIGDFKTTAKISFICKGKDVAPKLLKSPFRLNKNIIQQMLDEAKVLLLSQKNNKSSKPVVNTDEDSIMSV